MKPDEVFEKIRTLYGYDKAEILSKSRKSKLVYARQVAVFLVVEKCNYTFTQAANIFKRDRTTLMHSHGRIVDLIRDERINLDGFNRFTKLKYGRGARENNLDVLLDKAFNEFKNKVSEKFSEDPIKAMIKFSKALD